MEDDRDLAEGLVDAFTLEGYEVRHATDGEAGLQAALHGDHDLVILDAMLPALSGFDLLRQLRSQGSTVGVLMLTARGEEVDKVRGLKLGADDYMTKPFGIMELMARVEARLRRAPSPGGPARLRIGLVEVDFRARSARRGERNVALTAREFEILECLAARQGEAIPRAELIAEIWGTPDDVDVSTRTVDQHVAALRRKLGDDPACPRLIETVYGYGYRLKRDGGSKDRSGST